ncbi:MAG: tRNA (adenosine(37)-N6)-dimethylallyltransferase MiaA [Robiginitalea sp.]
MKNFLVSISGPTGIGKTDWAIRLARHYNTEILSVDSRQFYREMHIGTAVPSREELQAAPHHFIQHRSIHGSYSVGDFRREALDRMQELFQHHRLLILAGGSGLYLDAITKGLDEFPKVDPQIRKELTARYEKSGVGPLQRLLAEKDPAYHRRVDLNNPHRLIRALEICLGAGKPFSSFIGNRKAPGFFTHIPLALQADREIVYQRIESRVDRMMEAGLLEEARALFPFRELAALQTVGYQELFDYFEGRWDLETAVQEIKKNTRRFAKRQGTWLRRDPEIHWVAYNAPEKQVIRYIDAKMKTATDGDDG